MQKKPNLILVEEGIAQECTLDAMRSEITPTELFYVRSHFPAPLLDNRMWQLEIDGEVEQPLVISFADLQKLPQKKMAVTMECAGNGRTFLNPRAPGLQFSIGAVGTAEWTGVSLADLLMRAGLKSSAVEVLMQGADQNPNIKPGDSKVYERSLPLNKALDPDTLLVFAMNGKELPIDHGYPVRAIVPGWYGMASVKWLTRIRVLDKLFSGQFQTGSYVMIQPGQSVEPVSTLRVKSLITSHSDGIKLGAGKQQLKGVAWSHVGIERVEISIDDGKSWQNAKVEPAKSKYAWQMWHFDLSLAKSGRYKIQVCATDRNGITQPIEPDWNEQGYEINQIHTISVEVTD